MSGEYFDSEARERARGVCVIGIRFFSGLFDLLRVLVDFTARTGRGVHGGKSLESCHSGTLGSFYGRFLDVSSIRSFGCRVQYQLGERVCGFRCVEVGDSNSHCVVVGRYEVQQGGFGSWFETIFYCLAGGRDGVGGLAHL